MRADIVTLTVTVGDDRTLIFDLLDGDGAAVDITGRTYNFAVIERVDRSPVLTVSPSVPTGTDGRIVVSITDTQTSALTAGDLLWWSLVEQAGTVTTTLCSGPFAVVEDDVASVGWSVFGLDGDNVRIVGSSTAGPAGRSLLSGSGAPSASLGIDGDVYVDVDAAELYGPKASGVWGSPTSLIGSTNDLYYWQQFV